MSLPRPNSVLHFLPVLVLLTGLWSAPAMAQEHNPKPFSVWLKEFMQDARTQGISQETLDEALGQTEPIERVIELDRKQPEGKLSLEEYLANSVTEKRIEEGRALMEEHRELLEKVGREYGVPPKFIVALWGIETNYGGYTGSFSTIDSLATLAYDGRRSEFFRGELLGALRIVEDDHISVHEMIGSWAGAMGQCQFMPSSFLDFAVDYDHDGRRDIWNTHADIFASIANYLSSSGWNASEGWGRPVHFEDGLEPALTDLKVVKTVREWKALGVMNDQDGELPEDPGTEASVIMVGYDTGEKVPYLVTNNFKVLLKWNRSRYFATAVGTLADSVE